MSTGRAAEGSLETDVDVQRTSIRRTTANALLSHILEPSLLSKEQEATTCRMNMCGAMKSERRTRARAQLFTDCVWRGAPTSRPLMAD